MDAQKSYIKSYITHLKVHFGKGKVTSEIGDKSKVLFKIYESLYCIGYIILEKRLKKEIKEKEIQSMRPICVKRELTITNNDNSFVLTNIASQSPKTPTDLC